MKPKCLGIIFFLLFISCKKDIPEKSVLKIDSVLIKKRSTIEEENLDSVKKKIFESCIVKAIPLIDSTNFDNYNACKSLSKKEQTLLGLEKVMKKGDENFIDEIGINYILKLSDKFQTLVITYQRSEEEFTFLINYDEDLKIIDFTEIAYDEIAESYIRTTSEISKNYIVTTNVNNAVEPAEIVKFNYYIDDTGKIIEQEVSR